VASTFQESSVPEKNKVCVSGGHQATLAATDNRFNSLHSLCYNCFPLHLLFYQKPSPPPPASLHNPALRMRLRNKHKQAKVLQN